MRPVHWLLAIAGAAGCGSEVGLDTTCAPGLTFNEVAAANESPDRVLANYGQQGWCDDHPSAWCCDAPDWVELYNGGNNPADVAGYSMPVTLDLAGRPFPGPLTVDEGGFLVIVAAPYVPVNDQSGCDAVLPFDYAFAGVDLNRDGDRVVLRSATGDLCEDLQYPDQHADFSWARLPGDGGDDFGDATPTPGASNVGSGVRR